MDVSQASGDLAKKIRIHTLNMIHAAKASHIGSCLSAADIIAVLYGNIMRYNAADPKWDLRDRFILSKGHAAAVVYAVLAETGFIARDYLTTYGKNSTKLQGHLSHHVPGVEISTGSLGHGLSVGCGMALAAKLDKKDYRVFVVLSDGECDEGSIWEAALFAAQHQLSNLYVIIDYNKIQSFGRTADIMDLEPFADKWRAFKWHVTECDGHNHAELTSALSPSSQQQTAPHIIIAHTIKGKGIQIMEDKLLWHYRSPDDALHAEALQELML